MTTWITVCDTCKRDDWQDRNPGVTDGEALAEHIERLTDGHQNIKTRRVSCMMGCQRGCNISIQGHDKLTYVLGRFEPNADDASAIIEYADKYHETETGRVPFREWPQGVKGHFTSRTAPLPTDDA